MSCTLRTDLCVDSNITVRNSSRRGQRFASPARWVTSRLQPVPVAADLHKTSRAQGALRPGLYRSGRSSCICTIAVMISFCLLWPRVWPLQSSPEMDGDEQVRSFGGH